MYKSFLRRVAECLSYILDARCLKVNCLRGTEWPMACESVQMLQFLSHVQRRSW